MKREILATLSESQEIGRQLARGMTAAQRFAFAYPAVDPRAAQDGRFNRLVDEWRGDQAWRVLVMIDASPHVPEGWPCWQCSVVYGEVKRGIATPAAPLFEVERPKDADPAVFDPRWPWKATRTWNPDRWARAEALIRRELGGVGEPDSLVVATAEDLMDAMRARGMGPAQVVGLPGRVRLTMEEAQACLPVPILRQFTFQEGGRAG